MGENIRSLSAWRGWIIVVAALAAAGTGCGKKDEAGPAPAAKSERLTRFCLQQFTDRMRIEVAGESAELSPTRESGTVKEPTLSLESDTDAIEVTTGADGRADIRMERGGQKMAEAVLQGDIRVVQKDRKTGSVMMEAHCRKLTFMDKQKMLLLEGKPVVTQGKNLFSGDRIMYYWNENRVEARGNVNVRIYPDKTAAH